MDHQQPDRDSFNALSSKLSTLEPRVESGWLNLVVKLFSESNQHKNTFKLSLTRQIYHGILRTPKRVRILWLKFWLSPRRPTKGLVLPVQPLPRRVFHPLTEEVKILGEIVKHHRIRRYRTWGERGTSKSILN